MVFLHYYNNVSIFGVITSSLTVHSAVRVTQSLFFCAVFCRPSFVTLYFFFWSLQGLSFFDLPLLITSLVSLPFSFIRHMVIMYSAVRQIVFQLLPIFACWHITWLHCLNSIMMASGNVANASYTDGYIIY